MTVVNHDFRADRCRLTLSGDIDLAKADQCFTRALDLIEGARGSDTVLTIDLAEVTFMDSTGLGMLVNTRAAANEVGMELRLENVPEQVRRVLSITRLDRHFGLVDDLPPQHAAG